MVEWPFVLHWLPRCRVCLEEDVADRDHNRGDSGRSFRDIFGFAAVLCGADHCFANAALASAMAFLKFAVLSPLLTRNVPIMKAGVPRNPNAAVWS
jgi:hypothetical protein